MSTELRNILKQQNIIRQGVNKGIENRNLALRNERQAILDALRNQRRRDDIVLSADFTPLDLRRREQRMDGVLRTVVSELVDGLNTDNPTKINVNLDRMREIMIKENPSLPMIGRVNSFLKQFIGKIEFLPLSDRIKSKIQDKILEVENLATNKLITDEQFQILLEQLSTDKIDEFSDKEIEEMRKGLKIPSGLPKTELKFRIESMLGKDLSRFKNPRSTIEADIIRAQGELRNILREKPLQNLIKDAQAIDPDRDFTELVRNKTLSKDDLVEVIVTDFSERNKFSDMMSIAPLPSEEKVKRQITSLKGRFNRFLDEIMTPSERDAKGLNYNKDIKGLKTPEFIELYEKYVSASPIEDLFRIRDILEKADLTNLRASTRKEIEKREAELNEKLKEFREAKDRKTKKEAFEAARDKLKELREEMRDSREAAEFLAKEKRRIRVAQLFDRFRRRTNQSRRRREEAIADGSDVREGREEARAKKTEEARARKKRVEDGDADELEGITALFDSDDEDDESVDDEEVDESVEEGEGESKEAEEDILSEIRGSL